MVYSYAVFHGKKLSKSFQYDSEKPLQVGQTIHGPNGKVYHITGIVSFREDSPMNTADAKLVESGQP